MYIYIYVLSLFSEVSVWSLLRSVFGVVSCCCCWSFGFQTIFVLLFLFSFFLTSGICVSCSVLPSLSPLVPFFFTFLFCFLSCFVFLYLSYLFLLSFFFVFVFVVVLFLKIPSVFFKSFGCASFFWFLVSNLESFEIVWPRLFIVELRFYLI